MPAKLFDKRTPRQKLLGYTERPRLAQLRVRHQQPTYALSENEKELITASKRAFKLVDGKVCKALNKRVYRNMVKAIKLKGGNVYEE